MTGPTNPALMTDLAEASAFFAQAAVNSMPTEAKFHLADLVASGDATLQVRVTIQPFSAALFVLAANGGDAVEVGRAGTLDANPADAQH